MISREQIERAAKWRVLFGHQSVGEEIVEGLSALLAGYRIACAVSRGQIRWARTGGQLVHCRIGTNGDPACKDAAFASILARTEQLAGVVILYKYCSADLSQESDVEQICADYTAHCTSIEQRYPGAICLPVTMPLTTAEPAWKAGIRTALGWGTERPLCQSRNHFNDLLRRRYGSGRAVFDLAEAESTRSDGTRSCFIFKGRPVYTLAAEYTFDGSHLNQLGRRVAATRLLTTLASL